MKKLFYVLAIAAVPVLFFTSCDNGENTTPTETIAESVEGTYDVVCNVAVGEQEFGDEIEAKLVLKKVDNTNVSLEIKDFKLNAEADAIPVKIAKLPLKGTIGNVSVDFDGVAVVGFPEAADETEMDTEISGTIKSRGSKATETPGASATPDELRSVNLAFTVEYSPEEGENETATITVTIEMTNDIDESDNGGEEE